MDIDDIFKDLERDKKPNNKQNIKQNIKPHIKPKQFDNLDEDDFKYLTNKSDRKFIDGLPIYTVEELKIGKGEDTEDCPFDCDCCY